MSKKMGQASKKVGLEEKILTYFYEYPSKKVTVRELANITKISRSTVQYYLNSLKKKNLISKNNQSIDSWENKWFKKCYYIQKIVQSGLVDYLDKELGASLVILFGSIAKGESVRESDIDLFVECAQIKDLNLNEFEKKLGHKIQLFMKIKMSQLPENLYNNVLNGIKLKGYINPK